MATQQVNPSLSRVKAAVGVPRAAVVGVGNALIGDDAFGPYVAAILAAGWRMPDGVALLDASTPRVEIADHLAGRRYAVIVDSVQADAPPGTVLTWRKAELLDPSSAAVTPRAGGRDPALRDMLQLLELAGRCPDEVVLVGAVPSHGYTGSGLSPSMRAAVMGAAEEVVRQLAELGYIALPLARRRVPDIWWERVPPETFG